MTTGQLQAIEKLWPLYGIEAGDKLLNFDDLFGGNAGVVLEIGFGNGDSLVEQARQHPHLNYLGIDVHMPGVGHCLLQIEAQGIRNLRLIAGDAIDLLQARIETGSLERVNLYFPDPWPKKRHHKRRIIQPSFFALVARALGPKGEFFIATDWAGYAEHINATLERDACFDVIEHRKHGGDAPLDRVTTKFERRGLDKGHAIWDWQLRRV